MQQIKRDATRQAIDVTVVIVITTHTVAASLASWSGGRRTACVQASQPGCVGRSADARRENEAGVFPSPLVCQLIFCLAKMKATAASPSPLPPPLTPPPPRGHDKNHWKLISQGAEARLWLIDNYLTIVSGTRSSGSNTSSSSSTSRAAICKERFAKSYRHPTLDVRLTKSRTKAEARCLTRCRKAGVRCPAVLGVELAVPTDDAGTVTSTILVL